MTTQPTTHASRLFKLTLVLLIVLLALYVKEAHGVA